MSLCTLPAPVSPHTLGISPHINVVLFTTESHLILCRRSGQQVWTSRLPHANGVPERVTSISWSPDGQFFALLFSTGIYAIYDVKNGRSLPNQLQEQRISSIAWTQPSGVQQKDKNSTKTIYTRDNDTPSVTSILDPLISLATSTANNSFAATGTSDGKLRISVYGALNVDEIQVDTTSDNSVYLCCADEDSGEYAAVQNTKLHVFRAAHATPKSSYKGNASTVLEMLGMTLNSRKSATQNSASAIRLADDLLQNCIKLSKTLEDMRKVNQSFFEPFFSQFPQQSFEESRLVLQAMLIGSIIHGEVTDALKTWIESLHEQGFKRWYKSISQHWDSLHRLVTEDIIATLEKLVLIWGQLQTTENHSDREFVEPPMPRLNLEQLTKSARRIESLDLINLIESERSAYSQQPAVQQEQKDPSSSLDSTHTTHISQESTDGASEKCENPGKSASSASRSLNHLMFKILAEISPQQQVFEHQATYLEHIFREEIDRPIAVTKISSVILTEVAEMLLSGGLVGEIDVSLGHKAVELATEIQDQLDSTTEVIRAALRDGLKLVSTTELGETVRDVRRLRKEKNGNSPPQPDSYGLILDSGKLVILDHAGSVISSRQIEGTNPVFTGDGTDILSLDTEQNCLILPNGDRLQLDFEPIAVAIRRDNEELVACVLSEDCQHYQFKNIPKCH